MPTRKTKQVPVSLLVEDQLSYPRKNVSALNVANITEALRAGATIPPPIVDDELRIVDGVHRARAWPKVCGPDKPITVEVRQYESDADRLADAIALNVGRGLDLTRWDIDHVIALAEEKGLPQDRVAQLMSWQPDRLRKYAESRMARTFDEQRIALKRSIRHKMGQRLTERQVQANDRLSGMSPAFHATQLIELLEADLVPADHRHLAEQLAHLEDLLAAWLQSHPTEAAA